MRITGVAHFRMLAVLAVVILFQVTSLSITARSQSSSARKGDRQILAPTPPMGWNSWDSYGTTITEAQFKSTSEWFAAHLKRYGWQYVVVDEGWTITDPGANPKDIQFTLDDHGRYIPAVNRFPSATDSAGFKPLADYVHALGLKFGIHILRGIPRQAVKQNLPIAGSHFKAAGAADTSAVCPWNTDNYGLKDSPAGQAYYDSLTALYAGWGVDFIKVDCIADHPYVGFEIRMLSEAIRKTGRPIVLSLSPGAAPIEKADELRRYAQLWRISDDVWDVWYGNTAFPQGVKNQFPRAAQWAPLTEPGHWPDADMLPIGHLGPAAGWGKSRDSRLTHDEQRTMLTLWSMFRSPLMIGGNLLSMDDWTTALLTNPEVIAVDQQSRGERQVISTERTVVWTSHPGHSDDYYLALFNIGDSASTIHYSWKALGLDGTTHKLRDLWERKDIGAANEINVTVPPHGCVLYRVSMR